ncbi:Pyridine nucleotide-disulphide oxidoreductase [Ferrithrix thermotolerans DSM 19514]|uniref:Pyridine nucleotide-disulphide oxidoreductase n=1 Tax=Ferrithrix thermotolerans DSM 19514 TaxID=1121881 RepID=A0A1M4VVJ2_9ACTN|nr:FAD/NAD(P)-binding oxidoreductase [Ferrithrix thermotolerans]SHE72762.1 Pyridine nucleotide-disulphide oxidoreductase [Ferrithrix thermotolerans DSM 19514]
MTQSSIERCVIVGASLAGFRSARELRRLGFKGEIVLIGEEHHHPYQRPPLSKQILKGTTSKERVYLRGTVEEPFSLRLGVTATSIDQNNRVVFTSDHEDLSYDALIVATGATPITPPGLAPSTRVMYFRTLDDAVKLRASISSSMRIGILGAGFIGSEIASSLVGQVSDVVLFDASPTPMAQALGTHLAKKLSDLHRKMGVKTCFGEPIGVVETDAGSTLIANGSSKSYELDLLVVGVGVRPATNWLGQDSGFQLGREGALLADSCGRIDEEGVHFAVGDVASWYSPHYKKNLHIEHFESAVNQALNVARYITNAEQVVHELPFAWTEQHGHLIQTIGVRTEGSEEEVITKDAQTVVYFHDGLRLTGAALFDGSEHLPEIKSRITNSLE